MGNTKERSIFMSKETQNTATEFSKKRSRYSSVSIIMRQLYGSRLGHLPGYFLLQDVIYKHLVKKNMSLDELVTWSTKKFIFTISQEEAYKEIQQVITQNLPEPEKGPDNSLEETKAVLTKVLEEATDLYEKQSTYAKVSKAVREMEFPDTIEKESIMIVEQDIIKILFEIKRGKNLDDAISKIAQEETETGPQKKQEERKEKVKKRLRNTILLVFSSEIEMLNFADGINID